MVVVGGQLGQDFLVSWSRRRVIVSAGSWLFCMAYVLYIYCVRMIDKYPYKKILPLNWYEAAIGHLLFFKNLKERMKNNVYFLICEKGILLKAATPDMLKQSEEEVNKFFNTAKIQQLDLTHSPQFYENIVEDIKGLTSKLKDSKDCPYINLVYSDKIKQSCLALRKYGYNKPYEIWEQWQRDKKGFCFLIVRPDYRWKQIANSIYNLVKKRESSMQKPLNDQKMHTIQIPYLKFIWLYLQKDFNQYRQLIQIKQKKSDQVLLISLPNHLPNLQDLQRQIDSLSSVVMPQTHSSLTQMPENDQVIAISANQIEKITENLYHEFGIPNFVKRLRQINGCLIVGPAELDAWMSRREEYFRNMEEIQGLHRISPLAVRTLWRLGKKSEIVEYQSTRYFCRRISLPLRINFLTSLKTRLPCLPRYFFYYQRQSTLLFIRQYYPQTLISHFSSSTPLAKLRTLHSLAQSLLHLHAQEISPGREFKECVYVEGDRVILDCFGEGEKNSDLGEIKEYLDKIGMWFEIKSETERAFMENLQGELAKTDWELKNVCEILERFQNIFV